MKRVKIKTEKNKRNKQKTQQNISEAMDKFKQFDICVIRRVTERREREETRKIFKEIMYRFFKLNKIMNPLFVKYNKAHQKEILKDTDTKTYQVIFKTATKKNLSCVRGGKRRETRTWNKDISGYPGGNGEKWGYRMEQVQRGMRKLLRVMDMFII